MGCTGSRPPKSPAVDLGNIKFEIGIQRFNTITMVFDHNKMTYDPNTGKGWSCGRTQKLELEKRKLDAEINTKNNDIMKLEIELHASAIVVCFLYNKVAEHDVILVRKIELLENQRENAANAT